MGEPASCCKLTPVNSEDSETAPEFMYNIKTTFANIKKENIENLCFIIDQYPKY